MKSKINPEDVVHQQHCCVIHGCKYMDKNCPVAHGVIKQKYICEDCNEIEGWKSLDDVKAKIRQQMGGMLPYITPDQYDEHWAEPRADNPDFLAYKGFTHFDNNLMSISEPSEPYEDCAKIMDRIDTDNQNDPHRMADIQKKIHDDSTIRLLEVLGELTVDLEINNDITAMNFAATRLKRYEGMIDDYEEAMVQTSKELSEAHAYINTLENEVNGHIDHAIDLSEELGEADRMLTLLGEQGNRLVDVLNMESSDDPMSYPIDAVMALAVERIESQNEDIELAYGAIGALESEVNRGSLPNNIEVDGMIYVPISLKDFHGIDFIDDTVVETMAGTMFNNLVRDYEALMNDYHDKEDKLNEKAEDKSLMIDALMHLREAANLCQNDTYSNSWNGTIHNAAQYIERKNTELDEVLQKFEIVRMELNQATIYYKDCDVRIKWYKGEEERVNAANTRLLETMGMGGVYMGFETTTDTVINFITSLQDNLTDAADAWREADIELAKIREDQEDATADKKIDSIIFNQMCANVAMDYNMSYYDKQLHDVGFTPYNNMEQLIWMFDLVTNYSDVEIFIQGGTGSDSNFMGDYMREYIYENVEKL